MWRRYIPGRICTVANIAISRPRARRFARKPGNARKRPLKKKGCAHSGKLRRSPLPKPLRMNRGSANLPRSRPLNQLRRKPRNGLRRKLRRNVPARRRSWRRSAPHNRHKLLRAPGNKRHGHSRRRIVTPRRLLTSNLHHRPHPRHRRMAHPLRSARHGCQPMQTKTRVAPPG